MIFSNSFRRNIINHKFNLFYLNKGLGNPISKTHYEKVNEKIEKLSGKLYFALVKISLPAFVLPDFIVSFFLYFSTDLGNQAFKLPFPTW